MSLVVKDVRGDGSCFFRSLYHSMVQLPLKNRVIKSFDGKDMDIKEDAFVVLVRDFLSKVIKSKKDAKVIGSIYKNLKTQNKENLDLVIEGMSTWMQKIVKSSKWSKMTASKFREEIAEEVLKKNNWVSEMEVEIVKNILKRRADIDLRVLNSQLPKTLPKDVIYVMNIDEIHYNAVVRKSRVVNSVSSNGSSSDSSGKKNTIKSKRVLCDKNKILNPKTNRCVSKTSCKGFEVMYYEMQKENL